MTAALCNDDGFRQRMATLPDGRECIIVRNAAGALGYENRCPHIGVGLDWGDGNCLDEERDELVCAMHGARFAPDDGSCLSGPCDRGLTPIPLHIAGGKVWLDAHE